VDWIASKVNVDHGIVAQQLDSVKTEGSRKSMNFEVTEFRADDDFIFSSPYKLGRLPYSYTGYHCIIENAAKAAGLGRPGTHSFRHTFRSWLDAVGTALTVQQKLMRHADIQKLRSTFTATW
jgi:integrase